MPWNKCNAKCKHCGQNSSPKSPDRVSDDKLYNLIEEASSIYSSPWFLSLSGGEIFIEQDNLYGLIKATSERGGYTTLMTNCFWANKMSSTIDILSLYKSHGLKMLGVSCDNYHGEFINLNNILNVLEASKKLQLPVIVKVVASKNYSLLNLLQSLKDKNVWFINFMEMPLIREGRANHLPEEVFHFAKDIPSSLCPGLSMTINAKGNAMICCNGGGSFPSLQLGNISDYSLRDLEYLHKNNPLSIYLCNKGPLATVDFLQQDEKEKVLNRKYVNECDLCTHIFSDEERGKRIKSKIENIFISDMQNKYKHILI